MTASFFFSRGVGVVSVFSFADIEFLDQYTDLIGSTTRGRRRILRLGVPVGELKKWESVYEFPVFMALKYPMSGQMQ